MGSPEAHDVAVIGAGLAGLRCATVLAEAGMDVVVLEAGPVVGGRQRTDTVDGFRLDRGFQVLNPAYPALKRALDARALALHAFPVGVRVRRERGAAELRHPLRHPLSIPATLGSGLVSPRDAVALARWITPALLRPQSVVRGPDVPLRDGWDAAGLRGPLRTEVLEPFLAGVVAEDRGETSDAFARLLVRMFALGRPGLPEQGIAALPAALAARARGAGARIRLHSRVAGVAPSPGGLAASVAEGDAVRATRIVVAVGPEAVTGLTPLERPRTRGLQTWWFAADGAAAASALLAVDGHRQGPIVNTVVMSHTVPSYAPAGRHLVEATCLLPEGTGGADEPTVRRHLSEIWDADVAGWELLRRDDIPDALPAQVAPLRARRPVRCGERLYVAGDHRDTASIQGALVSGERAARAVLADAGR